MKLVAQMSRSAAGLAGEGATTFRRATTRERATGFRRAMIGERATRFRRAMAAARLPLLILGLLGGCGTPGVELTLQLRGMAQAHAADSTTLQLTVEGDSRSCCGDLSVSGKFAGGSATLRYQPATKARTHLKFSFTLLAASAVIGRGSDEIDWAPGQRRALAIALEGPADPPPGGPDLGGPAVDGMACQPNSTGCLDANTLQRCKPDGSGYVTQVCPGGTCNSCLGSCGLRYCDGDNLTDCVSGKPTLVSACAYGCDAGRAVCRQPVASNFDLQTYLGQQPGGVGCIFTDPAKDAAIDTNDSSGTFTNFERAGVAVVPLPGGFPAEALLVRCQSLTIPPGRALRVTGTRAIIFAVFGAATVKGLLDAGGHRTATLFNGAMLAEGAGPGGGANPSLGPGFGQSGTPLSGSGGGGYGTAGGNGGEGQNGVTPLGGMVYGANNSQLIPLFAGSAAGKVENNGDQAGYGGGALQITSLASVVVEPGGVITVGGAGGRRAQESEGAWGGGGGGAAGSILLEAPVVTIKGGLVANGGGGGGSAPATGPNGCGSGDCGGEDGRLDTAAAAGGAGTCPGGNGGNGVALPGAGVSRGLPNPGDMGGGYVLGGGGGGAAGRIRLNARAALPTVSGATLSPPPSSPLYSVGPLPAL